MLVGANQENTVQPLPVRERSVLSAALFFPRQHGRDGGGGRQNRRGRWHTDKIEIAVTLFVLVAPDIRALGDGVTFELEDFHISIPDFSADAIFTDPNGLNVIGGAKVKTLDRLFGLAQIIDRILGYRRCRGRRVHEIVQKDLGSAFSGRLAGCRNSGATDFKAARSNGLEPLCR